MIEMDYRDVDDLDLCECINLDDGQLVFEQRDTLTEDEKELADIHVGCCLSCRMDMEFDRLMNRMEKENSRC